MSKIVKLDFSKLGKKAETKFPEAWDFDKDGKVIVGKFVSKKTGVGENNSMMYYIKVEDKRRALWGSVQIDTAFETIPINSMVEVTFQGKEPSGKGNREIKNYEVRYIPPDYDHEEEVDHIQAKEIT